ncbi:MAG: potassium-transporting ATPase subunit KdpC [Phycisphaeraceae bacterium]|nr:potassium-transporting ATPase subunit KdpC [Phycisphaeraceae bacterium]
MLTLIRPALVLFALFSIVTGIAYPLAITGVAQVVFPAQANGSLIARGNGAVGSTLIGQEFASVTDSPAYLWSRPSATAPVPYTSFNADKLTGSSGSNLAPTNPALIDNVKARIDALRAADSRVGFVRPPNQLIPVDLITSSASGLDPHISPAAAEYQLSRVAKARHLSDAQVRELVALHTQARQFGVLGEPTVNVLALNLDLDAHFPSAKGPAPLSSPTNRINE